MRADRLLDLSPLRASGERAATFEEARRALEQRRARRDCGARPRSAAGAAGALRRGVAAAKQARVRARLRGSPAGGAQPAARPRRDPRARAAPLPRDHGRRVPGHEPAAVRAGRPARARRHRAVLRRRRVPVDLRLPARRRRRLPGAPRGHAERPPADAQLPLAAGGARRRQRAVRLALRRRVPAAARLRASSPTPCSAIPSSCSSRTRRATRARARTGARAEARHIARRVRELVDAGAATPGEIVLLFAAGTDARVVRGGAAPPACRPTARRDAATSASSRWSTCSRTCGSCTTATTTRRSSPCSPRRSSASPTTRSSCSAARPPRRPLFTGLERSLPEGCRRDDERLLRAFRQRYERLVRRSPSGSRSSGCASGSSPSTTTTSPCSRGGTAGAATRTCASSRGSPARTRSCAAPTSRASSASSASRRRSARASSRRSRRRRARDAVRLLTIHAAKGLEFKVVIVADAGRDRPPPSSDEILALADGRFGFQVVAPADRHAACAAFDYEDVREARKAEEQAERLRLYYVAMTRAIDRLIVSGAIDPRRPDAATPHRLGARPARPGARARRRGRAGARSSAAARACSLRVDRFRRAGARRRGSRAARGRASSCCFDVARGRSSPRAGGAEAAPRSSRSRRRRSTARGGSRSRALSLSSGAARTSTSRSRVAGMRERRPSGRPRARAGLAATEIGDAAHRAARGGRPARPAPARRRAGARLVPDGHRRGARSDPRLRRVVLRLRARAPDRRAGGRGGRAAVRVRARRRPPPRPRRRARASTASGRSSSTTRRTSLGDASPAEVVEEATGCSGSSTRSRASAPARSEVEVVYQFLERADDVVSATVRAGGRAGAGGGAVGRDRGDRGGPLRADAERVRLRRLPGARRRLRRRRRSHELAEPDGRAASSREARRRVGPKRDADRPDRRAARRRARRRDDRAALPQPARAARLGDALRADDGRERQPRHARAVREVPAAGGLPRRPAGGARARHLRDRLLPPEGEVDARARWRCCSRSTTARCRARSTS